MGNQIAFQDGTSRSTGHLSRPAKSPQLPRGSCAQAGVGCLVVPSSPLEPDPPEQGIVSKIDAATDSIEALNLPKTVGRIRQVIGIVSGLSFILLGLVLGLLVYSHHDDWKLALILFGFLGGSGALSSIGSFISYRQLTRAQKAPETFTQFHTGTATTFRVPLKFQAAQVGPDESIENWFGPVSTQGKAGIGSRVLAKEVDSQAINTLLFTNVQCIGLMLGPDDLQHLRGSGPVKSLANSVVRLDFKSGFTKSVQFGALNANHWDQMVDALSGQPLEAALVNHLNFGLPYDHIDHVEVENHFVNPGLTFHLKDGRRLRYSTFKRDKLPELTGFLKQFVSIQ
jgi:hypothetical protein